MNEYRGTAAQQGVADAALTDEEIEAIALEQIGFDGGLQAVNGMDIKSIVRAAERKIASHGQALASVKSIELQIAEALRTKGLTLAKTATGYDVLKLGEVTAQQAPTSAQADSVQEDAARLWGAFVEEWRKECGVDHVVTILGGVDKLRSAFMRASRAAQKEGAVPLSAEQRDETWDQCKYDNGEEWTVDWENIVDAVERHHGIKKG